MCVRGLCVYGRFLLILCVYGSVCVCGEDFPENCVPVCVGSVCVCMHVCEWRIYLNIVCVWVCVCIYVSGEFP